MTDVLLHGGDSAGDLPFTVTAGDNRLLVCFHAREVGDTATLTAVDIDGVAGHIITQNTVGTVNVYGYYWLESELTAAFVQGAAINKTGAPDTASGMLCAVLLENATQAAPSDFYSISQNATGSLDYTLDEVNGGLGLLFASSSKTTGTWTFNGSYSQLGANHNDGTNTQAVLATKAPSADTTATTIAVENSLTGDKLGLVALMFDAGVAAGMSITSVPSTMAKAETGVQFQVTAPLTAPTVGNTTVVSAGDSLTVTSVTGSDPYTINCTVPLDISKQVGSYAWTITIDAENDVSSSVPLTVQTGWTSVDLVSPVSTVGYMLNGYTGDAAVTGDTLEHESVTDLTVGADSEWIWSTAPVATQTSDRRVIQADGTVGTTETATFTVGGGGSSITSPYRVSVGKIAEFLRSEGTYVFVQSNELVFEWLVDEGVVSSSLNEMLYVYLGDLGYTGGINDRMRQWRLDS